MAILLYGCEVWNTTKAQTMRYEVFISDVFAVFSVLNGLIELATLIFSIGHR